MAGEQKILSNDHHLSNQEVLDCEKLNYEKERIHSFATWPVHLPVDPNRLAKAGFYYAGVDDEVICFCCHGHVKNWNYGDVVLKKHAELYPDCDFIKNVSNNVPLSKIPFKSTKQPLIENADNIICNSSVHTTPVDFTKMKLESERLKTFAGRWPLSYINITDLVQAGFFYLGFNDKVQCAYCKGIFSDWEAGDVPYQEHMKHFPYCEYISQNAITIKKGASWFNTSQDICGNMKAHTNGSSNNNRLIDINQQHMNLEDLGVHLHKGPVHPQQASLTARLRSFISWSSNSPVSKDDLAAAGFFYIGINDHTKCFHCNGGLCNWEKGDDPWIEHARWFCNCDFLRLSKGNDFIKSCIAKYSAKALKEDVSLQPPRFQTMEPLMKKVDEAMNSNLVKYVLETELFPSYVVRAAILLQIKETGYSFSNIDELCIAVSYLKEEMETGTLNVKSVEAADLNICENISKKCVISDVSPQKQNTTSNLNFLPDQQKDKSFNNGDAEKSASCEDMSKDHCLCKICMDKEVGVVFLPCGHLLSCTVCAPALQFCPMCRKNIQATVRAYLN